MKHTPGPWFINGHERYTKYVEARIGGGWVQEVAACGPTENPEQQEANARLCAAAPDLLEGLKKALEPLEMYHAYGWPDRDGVIGQIKSAIAKATA